MPEEVATDAAPRPTPPLPPRNRAEVADPPGPLPTGIEHAVRHRAVETLARIGTPQAVTELLRIRREEPERAAAVGIALRSVRRPDAVEPILAAIEAETDARVQAGMARALGHAGTGPAKKKLRKLLRSPETAPEVKGQVALALAECGDVRSVGPIVELLDGAGPDAPGVRLDAIDALKAMAGHRRALRALRERAVPVLRKVVNEESRTPDRFRARDVLVMLETG